MLPFGQTLLNCASKVEPPAYLLPPEGKTFDAHSESDLYDLGALFPHLLEPAAAAGEASGRGKGSFKLLKPWPRLCRAETAEIGDGGTGGGGAGGGGGTGGGGGVGACAGAAVSLDEAQQAALRHALTKEVALIVGTPATGKSRVTLLALRALLLNKHVRVRADGNAAAEVPVLVVCDSNASLDQLLEGLLASGAAEPSRIARVGAPSDVAALSACELRARVAECRGTDETHAKAWKALSKQQKEVRERIDAIVEQLAQREPTAEDVEEVCTTAQIMSMCAAPSGWLHIEEALATWLEPVRAAADERAAEALLAETAARNKKQLLTNAGDAAVRKAAAAAVAAAAVEPKRLVRSVGNRRADWAAITRIEYAETEIREGEMWEEELLIARNGESYLASEVERAVDDGSGGLMEDEGDDLPLTRVDDIGWPDEATQEMLQEHDDLWQLDAVQREQLAWLWLHKKFEALYATLAELCEKYERACRDKHQLDQHLYLTALKSASVVGMTSTALAKHASLVSALSVQVIVAEEAAELLESSLLVALTPAARHLILVGDRHQLRPRTAVTRLAKQFRMPVTMLERLMARQVEHASLTVQHRMRPPLSRLVSPFYPAIADHAATRKLPAVPGVERTVYMLRHTKPESLEPSTQSRCSPHEAKFVAALAAYLLRQGMKPSQVVVLTPYCGQLLTIRRELRALPTSCASDVRTSTIDAFRGEESCVVILSLVRSSPVKPGTPLEIGSLGSETRVTMALTRARQGLYIIGNAEALAAQSSLWEAIVRVLTQGEAIGTFLSLAATRTETGKRALVRSGDDFEGVVGEPEARLGATMLS